MPTPLEKFLKAVGDMEKALAESIEAVSNPDDVEEITKLAIKKEIVLELLLEEFPPGPTPPPGCETCSIFYNNGGFPATRTNPDASGTVDPLRIRFCGPCSNPRFNEVVVQFNDQSGINDFRFEGFVTNFDNCDAATDAAHLVGQGTIDSTSFNFEATINPPVMTTQLVSFNFTDPNNAANDFSTMITIDNPNNFIDVVDCTA